MKIGFLLFDRPGNSWSPIRFDNFLNASRIWFRSEPWGNKKTEETKCNTKNGKIIDKNRRNLIEHTLLGSGMVIDERNSNNCLSKLIEILRKGKIRNDQQTIKDLQKPNQIENEEYDETMVDAIIREREREWKDAKKKERQFYFLFPSDMILIFELQRTTPYIGLKRVKQ